MKRVLLMVCSICLVLACVFGLFACVACVQDIMNVKEYKTRDTEIAMEGIATARDGIQQLKDNQQAYLDGADTFSEGLAAYNEGAAKLAAGEKAYAEGKKAYEEGKQKIADNTQAYNEGKAMLEKIEPLMPYLDQYIQFRDGSLSKLPGFDSAQLWFVGVVRPLAKNLGLEIPEDVTDFPAYMQQMVAEGKAKLKEYEDGLKQLQEAEKMLADAEKQLDKGRKDLAAGGAQLADGDAQLNVFEQGEVALAEGAYTLFHGMVPCYHWYSGEETIMSLPEYMAKELNVAIPDNLIIKNTKTGENEPAYVLNEEAYAKLCDDVVAQMYLVDENGEKIVAPGREGFTLLDLDKCSVLFDKAEQYIVDQEADITKEATGRMVVCGLAAIACILGLVGGISGNGKTGFGCGLVSAILAVAANVVGLITGYTNYIYPTRVNAAGDFVIEPTDMDHYVYSGSLQLKAVIILAVVAVVFVIVAAIARKASKDSVSAVSAETTQAAAAGAAAAAAAEESSSEQISKLEAENAALKEMVANLAAEAATVKE